MAGLPEKIRKILQEVEIGQLSHEEFIERLLSASQSSEQLQHMIRDLTVKELRELAKKMGQPVRSKDTAEEIRSELIRFIQARDVWHKISGTARTD